MIYSKRASLWSKYGCTTTIGGLNYITQAAKFVADKKEGSKALAGTPVVLR